ncbi:conserved hypothetical protein [Aurantimonas manganoxydans SI85-9A1]|uniref:Glycosyltransferase n=1 Tax=Aurantimonas manganoxydans (strain ATCC BAA-1229 / DSM 21871 / SI85-9A1) TaxID=287752 RepID=Q1YND0_AURMS|nr:glycosyl transferase [Aurantimonas manganoxydans]EAS51101.1 conserved hypothetical protein [Aurantimonas manganoxydans SI85-9A1]
MRVISLSTIPSRFEEIGPTLETLLTQTGHIDEVRLYVPQVYRRFPDYDGSVPKVPTGISIFRPDHDLGPASKILFAAKDLRDTDAQILFCDDDQIYGADWAEQLFEEQAKRPNECVALFGKLLSPETGRTTCGREGATRRNSNFDWQYRVAKLRHQLSRLGGSPQLAPSRRRIGKSGYADILLGYGGVVVRPRFFDEQSYTIPPVLWSVDDFWLSGMLARNGVPIWLPADFFAPLGSSASDIESLFSATIDNADRKAANAACVRYMQETFGVWQ